jgi:hypothetical protein
MSNNSGLNRQQVRQFWVWFSKRCHDFGPKFENSQLINELDEWVTSLGEFTWEIGPGKVKANALVLSPNGDKDLLESTKEMIQSAIECKDWEYYYAKQPKDWSLEFEFETDKGDVLEIDASKWDYLLLQYEDGMFEVIFKAPALSKLDEGDKQVIAEILLDGILGEEMRIQKISGTEIVSKFESKGQANGIPVIRLSDHLKSLVG